MTAPSVRDSAYDRWLKHVKGCRICTDGYPGRCAVEAALWQKTVNRPVGSTS